MEFRRDFGKIKGKAYRLFDLKKGMKASKSAKDKTNAMRLLDAAGIEYTSYSYEADPSLSGEDIARILGEDPDRVFKTLVTRGKSGEYYVFVIPVNTELDLKKAAKAASEKSVAMIKQKELRPLTGYVHGGCSPVGMKKPFPTWIDETAQITDAFFCSAGRRGAQIRLSPEALADYIGAAFADRTK